MSDHSRREAMDDGYRPSVGVMLLNERGQVFVARRLDVSSDTWQMPQGGIDEGEEPRQAAIRELHEEIGTDKVEVMAESQGWLKYDLPRQLIPESWEGRWRGQKQKWFVMRFKGRDEDIDLTRHEAEFAAWRWVDVSQLPDLVVSFKRQLYIDILNEFPDAYRRFPGSLSGMLQDPIVRMTMMADGVIEADLYDLLQQMSARIKERSPEGLRPQSKAILDDYSDGD